MKVLFVQRKIASVLAAVLAAPAGMVYAAQNPQAAPQQQASTSSDSQQQTAPLESRPQDNQDRPAPNAAVAGQQPGYGQAPVGTAAAPYEKASGVTATRPAGAAIAPAKQRRMRQIFIKVGIVMGAGAAIAAVALLSHASPSTPH